MLSNAGVDSATQPPPEPASSSAGLGGGLFANVASVASSASDHLSALSSGAAAAATELALREELSRKEDALADAEAQIQQLKVQLRQQPQQSASAEPAAGSDALRESQEKVAQLEGREAKLKALLKKLHEAKAQLETRVQAA